MFALIVALCLQDAAELARGLGSDDVEARDAASKALIAMGRKAADAVRPLLDSSDPEVAARARSILHAVTRIPWHGSVADALAKDRPVMIVAARSATAAVAIFNREILGDADAVDFLRENFECAWVAKANGPENVFGLEGDAPKSPDGGWGDDVHVYFAAADGVMLHALTRPVPAEDLVEEAKLALEIAKLVADGKPEAVNALHKTHRASHESAAASGRFTADDRRAAGIAHHSVGRDWLSFKAAERVEAYLNPRVLK